MMMKAKLFISLMMVSVAGAFAGGLAPAELESVGLKVWQNECAGTRDGLTSWNEGEAFASLGIGHFIWYPAGAKGPFEESFPHLVRFLGGRGVTLPEWLRGASACPWKTKAEFQRDFKGARMEQLRELLATTVALQSEFLAQRMREALPKMLAETSPAARAKVKANFDRLAQSGAGTFALIDYVNFKGEGTSPTERYQGQGWGLLAVLEQMAEKGDPVTAFSKSASEVLARRVRNAPPERREERWLPGWQARVKRYVP